ncbi:hypothetical protein NOV72_04993 [Caballeronia novacaledonica]|uniref:Uncharacterized protein n=1 Tax=Caballeronia novacaledonica TaxID=1544861 RepID=A0A2U3IC52_9BURK|nr:hypothetical protein [Caballeronia novacaledonica]SPB17790.1 hypothetical protein NOV72_04993 [Caballeronia novacaledonica]
MNLQIVVSAFVNDTRNEVRAAILVTLDGKGVTGLRRNDFNLYVPAQHITGGFSSDVWGWRFEFSNLESAILEQADNPSMYGLYKAQLQSEDAHDGAWEDGNYYGILTVTHTVEAVVGSAGFSKVGFPLQKPHELLIFEPTTLQARTNFAFYVPPPPARPRRT